MIDYKYASLEKGVIPAKVGIHLLPTRVGLPSQPQRTWIPAVAGMTELEKLLAACENVVQRILKVRGRSSEVTSDLIDIFLVALLDLVAEQGLERSIAQTLCMTRWMIRYDIGDKRARKPFCPQRRIARQERIDRSALPRIRLRLC